MLSLSEKNITFLKVKGEKEFLEGTTAAGKTTIGISKWMIIVANSEKKFHIIAAMDKGTAEKNIINAEKGLLDQFNGLAEYYGNGTGNIAIPHIEYQTKKGVKIIYVVGYDDKKRWTKVLGGQVGCVFLDEVNIADMEFVREISHRCEYMMTTNNPDDPNLPIYKEYINRSRPLKKYVKDYPQELLKELNEPYNKGWIHWYFTFNDNASLTKEDIEKKKGSLAPDTKMYKNKILGLRGKATGLVFINFDRKRHVITKEKAKQFKYIAFSAGLDTAYSSKSPDTISMIFQGITEDRKVVILDEKVYNNRDLNIPIAPSDTVKNFIDFLNRNKEEWGLARNVFVDSADQATITELNKYKRVNPCIFIFNNAYKAIKITDRIEMQIGWFHTDRYLIVEHCKNHIQELETYSWKEEKDYEPEDANDHTINASQYGWIPYRDKIGISIKERNKEEVTYDPRKRSDLR
jgi:hypothetical protein